MTRRNSTISPRPKTPPAPPCPCHVCGDPVSYPGNEYRDVHDDCREADADE